MLSLASKAQQLSTRAIPIIAPSASKMAVAAASLAGPLSVSSAAAIASNARCLSAKSDGVSASGSFAPRHNTGNASRFGFSASLGDDRLAGFGATSAPKEDLVEQYLHPINASANEKHKLAVSKVRKDFERRPGDSGSSEVQVALLTYKIKYMTEHLKTHRKDFASRKGLEGMLSTRKRLLKYLRRTDGDTYGQLIAQLGLKDKF